MVGVDHCQNSENNNYAEIFLAGSSQSKPMIDWWCHFITNWSGTLPLVMRTAASGSTRHGYEAGEAGTLGELLVDGLWGSRSAGSHFRVGHGSNGLPGIGSRIKSFPRSGSWVCPGVDHGSKGLPRSVSQVCPGVDHGSNGLPRSGSQVKWLLKSGSWVKWFSRE